MKKFQFYKQHNAMDCGPTCLKMVTKHYGKTVNIEALRTNSQISKEGVSLLGIAEAAEKIAFNAKGVSLTYDELVNEAKLPAILHWEQNHFVVAHPKSFPKAGFFNRLFSKGNIEIADPGNGIISFTQINGVPIAPLSILWRGAGFEVLLLAFTLATWQLLKSLYKKSITSLTKEIKATRLKRNPEIFNAMLNKQEANLINLPEPDEAIRFGNPAAPYQLVIACNPYCGPCAKAHQAIEALYEKYPEQLSVSVRFALHSNDEKDNTVKIAREIFKAAKYKPYEAIKDWYTLFDIEKFKLLHQTNGEQVHADLEKHIEWNRKVEINGTPTFFVNGRKLPELYSRVDFTEILKNEIRN